MPQLPQACFRCSRASGYSAFGSLPAIRSADNGTHDLYYTHEQLPGTSVIYAPSTTCRRDGKLATRR